MIFPMLTTILFAAMLLVVVFLALMLTRGVEHEVIGTTGIHPGHPALYALNVDDLAELVGRLFKKRGLLILDNDDPRDGRDFEAVDPAPLSGQRLFVRVAPGAVVESPEVQGAIDHAKGEVGRAVVVTPGEFSDQARILETKGVVELIDGDALLGLVRAELPEEAKQLGLDLPSKATGPEPFSSGSGALRARRDRPAR